LGDVARRARAAPVEIRLDVGLRQRHAGRAAVDDAADRRAVALAEGRDAEQRAERAARHQLWFDEGSSSRLSTGQSRMYAFSMRFSSPPSMTTSEPMSCWDMTLSADESGSSGATVNSVPPFTRKMSLTFMIVSGELSVDETVLRRGRLRGVCGSI